eukprot:CAMPEP_0195301102 /NCGR_PEP_ID=MMETSP0707-20130614/28700_1 /TAXON_ID=33640 /ORGANISM="Asterionellopsis glacialis, Strain CCMP134" /LENGTH=409 /DNA_ID=CAMNT_0040363957 /DNA_START=101 /DNA_END=1327 /DNA_ORIENTATION=+
MKSSIVLLISSILSSSPVISASTSRNRRFRNNGVSSPAELPEPLSATSALGQKLLSKARRLEDEQDNNDNNAQTWVVGYSLKFLGCHAISQYNSEAEENDVLIKKKRLVRFRLCPTSSCMSTSLIGCATGYGDYVIDMNEYMYGYWEYKQQQKEYNCYMYGLNSCGCTEQDDDGDDQQAQDADEVEDFNEEQCLYQCFINAGKNECTAYIDYEVEENDDGQEKEIEQIDVSDYMRCAQIEFDEKDDDEEGRRGLEEEEEEEEDDVDYFVGPYCSEQGSAIYMGMYIDDTCTEAADSNHGRSVFSNMAGYSLPYGTTSLVNNYECVSCLDTFNVEEDNDDNDNDADDEENLADICNQLYNTAGKCEVYLSSSVGATNMNACQFIEGIKITTDTGTVETSQPRSNPVATAW